eukprot:2886577-Prorocentrum_lima.AAC.1
MLLAVELERHLQRLTVTAELQPLASNVPQEIGPARGELEAWKGFLKHVPDHPFASPASTHRAP